MHTKCNTFPKKFENSSLFITIRVCPWNFGIIQQKTAKSSAFLPLSPEFSRFVGLYSADFTGNGRVSRAKFVTALKGLGRFRRESSNVTALFCSFGHIQQQYCCRRSGKLTVIPSTPK